MGFETPRPLRQLDQFRQHLSVHGGRHPLGGAVKRLIRLFAHVSARWRVSATETRCPAFQRLRLAADSFSTLRPRRTCRPRGNGPLLHDPLDLSGWFAFVTMTLTKLRC